jgi:hypothetical protein
LRRSTGSGSTRSWCCCDLVNYGLFPEETLALLRERGIVTIRSNHDRWALGPGGATSA